MKKTPLSLALVTTILSAGCSTITQSENQTLALTAMYQDKPVTPQCRLSNDKGSWDSKAPANVAVRKSGEDLNITCKQDGMPDGILKAISRANGSMYGNIIFGGAVGALIDHSKGTGYLYPSQLPVKMGESVVVDRKAETQQAPQPQASNQACSVGQC